jgi:CheY-like chemotaxis protein
MFPQRRQIVRSILFVDDHEVLASLSCEILEMQGYRAISAHSGEEALLKFQDHEFDVLVTDMRLGAMNGLELARRLHEMRPDVPVILITGYEPVDVGSEAVACLQKENLFPALLDHLKTLLDQSGEEPEIARIA